MQPYSVRLILRRSESDAISEVEGARPRFECRWIDAEGQMSRGFPIQLPLGDNQIAELRWYLEEFYQFVGAGTLARAYRIEGNLNDWGKALFNAVFGTAESNDVYRNLRAAEQAGRPVVLTLGTRDPKILAQPWELMNDGRGPLVFRGVSLRRQLEGAHPLQTLEMRLPLRLLVIVARPSDSGFVDPRTSVRPLLDALELLPKGAVEAEFCQPPTLEELEVRISRARRQRRPFHIVHFDGHGAYLEERGIGALCFEDSERQTDLVPSLRLGTLLSRLEIPLVILEACYTANIGSRSVSGSMAPTLLQAGVGSVVAFSHAVHVQAATLLVERFYRELAEGLSIGEALEEARARLHAKPARWLALGPNPPTVKLQDWFVPQLYQVGPDLKLLADGEELSGFKQKEDTDPDWTRHLHRFPQEPTYRFQGRGRELLELERAFERHPAVVLKGMGGMGKTALSREAAVWWLRSGRFEKAVFCSFEEICDAQRLIEVMGGALEGIGFNRRSSVDQRASVIRAFRRQRLLLVWDNFEPNLAPEPARGAKAADERGASSSGLGSLDPDRQVGLRDLYLELTRANPLGRLLITCRSRVTGLPLLKQFHLEGLARHDSLHLLTAIADLRGFSLDRPGFERTSIEMLLDKLADHPLSVELVAPHLASLTPNAISRDFAGYLELFRDEEAVETKNRSLLASLQFSTSLLSKRAKSLLPFLAWFRRGVFEDVLVAFAELKTEAWPPVKRELESLALVRAEQVQGLKSAFLRFHPTLPFATASRNTTGKDRDEVRFLRGYGQTCRKAQEAMSGQKPAAGIAIATREELNIRRAIKLAFHRGEVSRGVAMTNSLLMFLQMAGRRRERDEVAVEICELIPDDAPMDRALCTLFGNHAQALVARGCIEKATAGLRQLANRIDEDSQITDGTRGMLHGQVRSFLAQVFQMTGQSQSALLACAQALQALRKGAESDEATRAAVLASKANALRSLGRLEEALGVAEKSVAIDEALGQRRNAAAGYGRCAQILGDQGRLVAAEERYCKAMEAARLVDDLQLQGVLLQHRGRLSKERGELGRSAEFYEEAVRFFQQANDRGSEMRTYTLLGTTERRRGHLDAAEAWYARSRSLARQLNDSVHEAVVAHNHGNLLLGRATEIEAPQERARLLLQACDLIEESLSSWLECEDEPRAAVSYEQLGKALHMLGRFEEAEETLHRARRIQERLDSWEIWSVYTELGAIAEARGESQMAAEWRAKSEAKRSEAQRRAGE